MELPNAFDFEREPVKFLARMKKRVPKNFRWTSSRSLEHAMRLAHWCYTFDRFDEAEEICEFLSQFEFAGDYNYWTWIELEAVS